MLSHESYDELATFFSLIGGSYQNPLDTDTGRNRRELARIFEILERDPNVGILMLITRVGSFLFSTELLEADIEAAVKIFATLGCKVEAATPAVDSPEEAFSTVVAATLAAELSDQIAQRGERLEPALTRFIERNLGILAIDYVKARWRHTEYWEGILSFFEKYDLLLTPTVAVPPFEIGIYGPREIAGTQISPLGWMSFTYPFNITNQPGASVPCWWTDDGLPIGLQIVDRRFDDATVLKAASAFEQASPWADRTPPLD